jgi:hypothetical protein
VKNLAQWSQWNGQNVGRLISQSEAASTQSPVPRLVAEWQERGLETLSGHTARKLRLVLALPQSVVNASAPWPHRSDTRPNMKTTKIIIARGGFAGH